MCSIIGRLTSGSIGLGALRGERPQPGALAAGHDHGLHRPEPTHGVNLPGAAGARTASAAPAPALAQRPQARSGCSRTAA